MIFEEKWLASDIKGRAVIDDLWEEEMEAEFERAREKGRGTEDKWNLVIDGKEMNDWQTASFDYGWRVTWRLS